MEPVRSQEEVASLYRRHVDMVYQICLMLMKNVPDAEDAVQTVFRKVMEYDRPFRDHEHEKAWLIVTARNECKNQLKHWWRTRRESEDVLNKLTWKLPEDGEGPPSSPCRKNTGWCSISTTTRATPPWRRRRCWGKTPLPSGGGWSRPAGS